MTWVRLFTTRSGMKLWTVDAVVELLMGKCLLEPVIRTDRRTDRKTGKPYVDYYKNLGKEKIDSAFLERIINEHRDVARSLTNLRPLVRFAYALLFEVALSPLARPHCRAVARDSAGDRAFGFCFSPVGPSALC